MYAYHQHGHQSHHGGLTSLLAAGNATTTPMDRHASNRPPSVLSSASSGDSGCSPGERFLPSLLAAPSLLASHPPQHHAGAATAAATAQPLIPLQGLQLNQLLHQTASLMAVNAQLRREIDQVRAAPSLKDVVPGLLFGGDHHHMAAAAAAAAAVAAASAGGGMMTAAQSQPPSLLPFQHQNGRLAGNGRKSPLPDSYKTVMCQAWLEDQTCSFGENCRFAHGEHELRPMQQPARANRKYKTKLCDKYTNTGLCPYGARCLFIHPDIGNNAYIRPDKLEELKKKQEERRKQHHGGHHADDDEGDREEKNSCEKATAAMPAANNTGKQPVATLMGSIGETPFRPRQALRPHPSWPLEPSTFFDRELAMGMESMLAGVGLVQQRQHMQQQTAAGSDERPAPVVQLRRNASSPVQRYDFGGTADIVTPLLSREATCPTPISGNSLGYGSECGGGALSGRSSSGSLSPLSPPIVLGAEQARNLLGGALSTTLMGHDDSHDEEALHQQLHSESRPAAIFTCGSTGAEDSGHSSASSSLATAASSAAGNGMRITLPPISADLPSWSPAACDPFATVFDVDHFARDLGRPF